MHFHLVGPDENTVNAARTLVSSLVDTVRMQSQAALASYGHTGQPGQQQPLCVPSFASRVLSVQKRAKTAPPNEGIMERSALYARMQDNQSISGAAKLQFSDLNMYSSFIRRIVSRSMRSNAFEIRAQEPTMFYLVELLNPNLHLEVFVFFFLSNCFVQC